MRFVLVGFILVLAIWDCTAQFNLTYENRSDSLLFIKAKQVVDRISLVAYSHGDTTELNKLIKEIGNSGSGCRKRVFATIFALHRSKNIYNKDIETIRRQLVNNLSVCNPSKFLKEEHLGVITKNAEVIDWMYHGIIRYDRKTKSFYVNYSSNGNDLFKIVQFSQFDKSQVIADIGSGTGFVPIFLAALYPGITITINDIDKKILDYAQRRVKVYKSLLVEDNIYFVQGDSASANLNYKYDVILMRNSLHHFDHPHAMISSLSSNLDKNGHIYVYEQIRPRKRKSRKYVCSQALTRTELKRIWHRTELADEDEYYDAKRIYLKYVWRENYVR